MFSFTTKKSEVQFLQALYKVDPKKRVCFLKINDLKGMCEIADFVLAKVPPGYSFDTPRKKCSPILTHPIGF